MNQNKLSADPTSLILGIVSLIIIIAGCCCGFLSVLSLTLSIVGLVLANKSLNEFNMNSENYSLQSRSNVTAGKIICIIGVVLSSIFILVYAAFFIFEGQDISKKILEKYYESKEVQHQVIDTTSDKQVSKDTLKIDSIDVE